MGCTVPGHGVEPLVSAQFLEHPRRLIFWGKPPKKNEFSGLMDPPSRLISQSTVIIRVVSKGRGGCTFKLKHT